ncbi:trk system potassium uptake protein TrkH [Rhodobacter aestuarii]|uniref:Trk system potassium uptake protein n=2 Tax=Rhodobacter aestuarii TaxID=453582 RepID=A0A1N7N858_9RHOB|nr:MULTISPECIES: TrkH family potassium uptake protein [Rhodobacter]PTV96285.1 trk system potassium uptake protein TrkH [Rhodobacter aestuarii]SIS94371.1 trk system potassium uptake protein TrkH [Rhodobacter aestuarii]SOB93115.1 trk system potassium uptake protein TrkH [Rhodobacter sp. JA431]
MTDFGPVFYIFGHILLALGAAMLLPAGYDYLLADPNWMAMLQSSVETLLFGALLSIASRTDTPQPLSLRQAYMLTAAIWLLAPAFAALPFVHGAPDVSLTDAYFEAASGLTTTGYTVFQYLDEMPRSVLLWRAMLQWAGGLGIAFVAMIFLPVMRIGGMRFFQTEGFDTFGKVLPRATDIALALLQVYSVLTIACALAYVACGMQTFDAIANAMTTMSTGGFATSDQSFAHYPIATHYASIIFMLLAGLPLIRFVQIVQGQLSPIWRDSQVRAFLRWSLYYTLLAVLWRYAHEDLPFEQIFRETAFNFVSILTGTGFGVASVEAWGAFVLVLVFLVGMSGGCTGSTSGSLSVFRVQVVLEAIKTAIRQLHSPNRVVLPRYDGKPLDEATMGPLILHVTGYILTQGIVAVLISMTGVDFSSALFASWGAIGNIGFGIGPTVAATGTMADYNDLATWLMSLSMLLGRLGLLAILVLVLPRFWRD